MPAAGLAIRALRWTAAKASVLTDFTFQIGGHFALILSGCRISGWIIYWWIRRGTRRIWTGSQDVTLRNSVFNSPERDDLTICLKASFGAKKFVPVRDILVEDCKVMGFDAGSVYAGQYTRDKLAATDRCKPCGRVNSARRPAVGAIMSL